MIPETYGLMPTGDVPSSIARDDWTFDVDIVEGTEKVGKTWTATLCSFDHL